MGHGGGGLNEDDSKRDGVDKLSSEYDWEQLRKGSLRLLY